VTELSVQAADLAGKRLEILREVVPGLRRLAIMGRTGNPTDVTQRNEAQAAAHTLGLIGSGRAIADNLQLPRVRRSGRADVLWP
jgi:hypothetical protein